MGFGLCSGLLWGLEAVILSIAFAFFSQKYAGNAIYAIACLHDVLCAILMFFIMQYKGRLHQSIAAVQTKSGKAIIFAALIGGPIGMSGYLTAINNIGPGLTAIISALYPAVGSFLAVLILKEKMGLRQVVSLSVALLAVMAMGYFSEGSSGQGDKLSGVFGAFLCVLGRWSEAVILTWAMKDNLIDNYVALHIRQTTSAIAYLCIVALITSSFTLFKVGASTNVFYIVATSSICAVSSYTYYYKALNCIGAARGMAANISYCAWATVFSFILLGTVPSMFEVICCIVIMIASVLSCVSDWSELGIK